MTRINSSSLSHVAATIKLPPWSKHFRLHCWFPLSILIDSNCNRVLFSYKNANRREGTKWIQRQIEKGEGVAAVLEVILVLSCGIRWLNEPTVALVVGSYDYYSEVKESTGNRWEFSLFVLQLVSDDKASTFGCLVIEKGCIDSTTEMDEFNQ
uniref:Uncharacterized protein n=1 Tax=Lactuca sativa TaxID=4236 RepID=A0A9R1XQ29_LACSA|nr:hypothetical protein LSAT_V11C200060900 [Lactuca sativa]